MLQAYHDLHLFTLVSANLDAGPMLAQTEACCNYSSVGTVDPHFSVRIQLKHVPSSPSISIISNENRFPTGTSHRFRDGLDKEGPIDQFKALCRNRRLRDGWPKSNLISKRYSRDPSKISAQRRLSERHVGQRLSACAQLVQSGSPSSPTDGACTHSQKPSLYIVRCAASSDLTSSASRSWQQKLLVVTIAISA